MLFLITWVCIHAQDRLLRQQRKYSVTKKIKKEDSPKHDFRFNLSLTRSINEDFLVRVTDLFASLYIIFVNLYFKVVQFVFDYIRYRTYFLRITYKWFDTVLRINDILGWIRIRIRGSMPLTNGSETFYFRRWPSRCQQKTKFFTQFFLLLTFWSYIYIIFQK